MNEICEQARDWNSCAGDSALHAAAEPESATTRWKGFRRYKADLLEHLLDEQYGLCCYSEIRPDLYDLKCHIEHVENKSQRTG